MLTSQFAGRGTGKITLSFTLADCGPKSDGRYLQCAGIPQNRSTAAFKNCLCGSPSDCRELARFVLRSQHANKNKPASRFDIYSNLDIFNEAWQNRHNKWALQWAKTPEFGEVCQKCDNMI